MSTTPVKDVLIAGGGIGGLTTALALAQGGARVRVLERAAAFKEAGGGVQQSANAMVVHHALGLADELIALGFQPEAATVRNWRTGRAEFRYALGLAHRARFGHPYLHLHRADLHAVLLRACRAAGVEVRMGHAVEHYLKVGDAVRVRADGSDFTAGVLIGADGIKSTVRDYMHGAEPPRFTGQVAWRAMVRADALPDGLIAPDANAWLGPGRHLVAYYVRGGEWINIVAVEERGRAAREGWRQRGEVAQMRTAFAGWDPAVEALLGAVRTCWLWGLYDRAPLRSWVDGAGRQGRVVLMGDAAHSMLPFLAQGAAMAVEDGWVLAQTILRGESLESYARRRRRRTVRIARRSAGNAQLFHERSGPRRRVRRMKFALAQTVPALAHAQFDGIYGVDVTGTD